MKSCGGGGSFGIGGRGVVKKLGALKSCFGSLTWYGSARYPSELGNAC